MAMLQLEQMGLMSESINTLRVYPSCVVYAESGCGKSVQVAEGFQDAFFVKSSLSVTRPYYSYLRYLAPEAYVRAWCNWVIANKAHTNHPQFLNFADQAGLDAAGAQLGMRAKLQETTLPSAVCNFDWINNLTKMIVAAKNSGNQLPFIGVVFDEWSDILARVYSEMERSGQYKSKRGKESDWAVQDACSDWLVSLCNMFRDYGLFLGFVCQEAKPVYFDGTQTVKYKGGPETPIGRLRETICRAPDIVLRITLETAPQPTGTSLGLPALAALPAAPAQPATLAALPAANASASAQPSSLAPPPAVFMPPVAQTSAPSVVVATQKEFEELFTRLPQGVRPPPYEHTPPERWAKRKFWTEAHTQWNCKFREFAISYSEPLGLRRLLERAGYI